MGVLVIPEGKTALFRIAIFIGLATVVTTIIYLTPVPDQYPQSCSRPCHELDWPMICRVKLTLERYQTLGGACGDCPRNETDCYRDHCLTVDGQAKGILAANRQFPGPTLQVCHHDIIVVDVVNRVPGQSFGVHWRGQPQSETPYMDGVPMVTQCPIPSLTTFQYKFRASESGTHVWQVNTGEEVLSTLFGPLIVRRPDSKEIHRKLYDTDDMANVVVIHPWNPQKANFLFPEDSTKVKLLINGKTQENGVPPATFKVSRGKRHRFRVILTGGARNCQVRLSIDRHRFLVIALDGHSIEPKMVTSARLFPGERLDFVFHGDQRPSSYYLRATPVDSCTALAPTFAVIRYDEPHDGESQSAHAEEPDVPRAESAQLQTIHAEECDANAGHVCLNDIQAARPIPEELATQRPHVKLYFFYNSAVVPNQNLVNTSFVALEDAVKISRANNLTMTLPSSPLLSQGPQLRSDVFCNNETLPERCRHNPDVCECVHMVDIPLNAVVELVLVNQDADDHVFHLHGYSFHVVGASKLSLPHPKPKKIKHLDEVNKLVGRNFGSPVVKDTVAVVRSSVVALRFKADNPGYWLLDEERGSHWTRGMSAVLHVGKKSDLAPIPKNFPRCGDWIGPEFFLV